MNISIRACNIFITGGGAMQMCNGQTLRVNNTMVMGNANRVVGNGNTVMGNANVIVGNDNNVMGNANTEESGTGNTFTGNANVSSTGGKKRAASSSSSSVVIAGKNHGIAQMNTSGASMSITFGGPGGGMVVRTIGNGVSNSVSAGSGSVVMAGNVAVVGDQLASRIRASAKKKPKLTGVPQADPPVKAVPTSDSCPAPAPPSGGAGADACVVCLDHEPTCIMWPCAHQVLCAGCAKTLFYGKPRETVPCPVCKVPVKEAKRVFK